MAATAAARRRIPRVQRPAPIACAGAAAGAASPGTAAWLIAAGVRRRTAAATSAFAWCFSFSFNKKKIKKRIRARLPCMGASSPMHGRPAEQNKARQQSRAPRQMQYRRFTLASADEAAERDLNRVRNRRPGSFHQSKRCARPSW